jgi:pimeloyl-ACP methyl ester carboxylesterase
MAPTTGYFEHGGHRLVFDEYGGGDRPVLLMPGLLLSRKMHGPLAETLAGRGYRVLCLDPLGHGDSDRPTEMWNYSMTIFGAQAIALMDHLGLDKAVVGGTSLGANATLEAAAHAQDRLQGMLIEMPVLDNALLAAAVAFTPLLVGLTFGAPLARLVARGTSLLPRRGPLLAQMALDVVSQDPKPSASVLQGLFFGRIAPPPPVRAQLKPPTLVIGHPRDPIHPFSDSGMLMRELPNARLVEASSILELRWSPERLTTEITKFIDDCWGGARRSAPRHRGARTTRPPASPTAGSRRRPG